MNKEKNSVQLLRELESLLTAKRYLINTDEINGVIAETAEEFVASINADLDRNKNSTPSATPKSEMPCNCHKEKTLNEKIINAVVDSVKKHLPPDTRVVVFID